MLEAARQTAKGLARELGRAKYYPLQNIVCAIEAYTAIDTVVYTGFDLPLYNRMWGQFRKYSTLKMYSSVETTVEVRYNSNLSDNWRRFVVCKEMCHALEADGGTHSNSTRSIDRIVSRFALYSAHKTIAKSFPAFDAESLAELGALELLCPLEVRKEIYASDDASELCERFGIPTEYCYLAFDPEYIEMVESL